MSASVLINPSADAIGTRNAVLTGRARQYDVRGFCSPLSVKSVIAGRATWTTQAGQFTIEPGSALIVHAGEEYDVVIDSLHPVETFCVFFADGVVEDAYAAAIHSSARLLDSSPHTGAMVVPERVLYGGAAGALQRAHAEMDDDLALDEAMTAIAHQLVRSCVDVDARVSTLPALRQTTREELRTRVARAIDYIHANIDRSLPVETVAREACLSLFHFHRVFAAICGETPHQYIARLRLQRAQTLLRLGRDVADVAASCGFDSVGSFTTRFARTFGLPPARFRRNEEVLRGGRH